MKKILLFSLLLFTTFLYSNGKSIELKTLLAEFNWSLPINDVLDKYSELIIKKKENKNEEIAYEIPKVTISDVSFVARLKENESKGTFDSFLLIEEKLTKKMKPSQLKGKMDNIFFNFWGDPDELKENPDGSSFFRIWYNENEVIEVKCLSVIGKTFFTIDITPVLKNEKIKDFRSSNWGDSKESVIKLENKDVFSNDPKLYTFEDNVAGLDCIVAYFFEENKLVHGSYIFKVEHSNLNNFIEDYEEVVRLMTLKYGDPKNHDIDWKDDLFKSDISSYGLAVSLGHLIYRDIWENQLTKIVSFLSGNNGDITFAIQYLSKKNEQLRIEKQDKEKSKKL